VNDAGQVIGFSTINTEADPLGFLGFPTHTFIWRNGEKVDIGTLGGSDTRPRRQLQPPAGRIGMGRLYHDHNAESRYQPSYRRSLPLGPREDDRSGHTWRYTRFCAMRKQSTPSHRRIQLGRESSRLQFGRSRAVTRSFGRMK